MSNVNTDDIEKIDEYFKVIDERIIAPIQNTDVKKSCTANRALTAVADVVLGEAALYGCLLIDKCVNSCS